MFIRSVGFYSVSGWLAAGLVCSLLAALLGFVFKGLCLIKAQLKPKGHSVGRVGLWATDQKVMSVRRSNIKTLTLSTPGNLYQGFTPTLSTAS